MKKNIIEIGLLAFFVSAVAFGSGGAALFEAISRAFIVFIGVELAATAVLAIISSSARETKNEHPGHHVAEEAAKHQQSTIHAKA